VVSGQSLVHGYAHFELAHHAAEHHALADEPATGSAVENQDEQSDHPHLDVSASVAAKIATNLFVVSRQPLRLELALVQRRETPPPAAEPRPRRDLPSTAPPRLRAPPTI
jgi:hypothetical protein